MKINSINSFNLKSYKNKVKLNQPKLTLNNTFAFSKTSTQAYKNQILFTGKRRSDNPNRNNFCQDYKGNVVNVTVNDYERDVARYENDAPFSGIMTAVDNGELINARFENGFIESAWKSGKLYKKYDNYSIKSPNGDIVNELPRGEALKIVEYNEKGQAISTTVEFRYLNGAIKHRWVCKNNEITSTDYSADGDIISQAGYSDIYTLKYANVYDKQNSLVKRIYENKGEYIEEIYNSNGTLQKVKEGGEYNIVFPEATQANKLSMEYPKNVKLYDKNGELSYSIHVTNKSDFADDLYVRDFKNNRQVVIKNVLSNSSYPNELLKEPQIVAFNFDETKPSKQIAFFDETTVIGDEIYSDELEEIVRILSVANDTIKEDDLNISKNQLDWFIKQLGSKFQIKHYEY